MPDCQPDPMTDTRCAFASSRPSPRSTPPRGTPAPIRVAESHFNQILRSESNQSDLSESPYNPFISYDFLHALEASGSATARTGWQPQHLLAEGPDGAILGVVPCYLKSHSRGEYVFDRGWAEAYERAGGQYYPKLQVSVPFTPATGRRLLVRALARRRQGARRPDRRPDRAVPPARGLVGPLHLPAGGGMRRPWSSHGFLHRTDQQFHWENHGYATLRRLPGGAVGAQAQDHQARAARRAGPRHHRAMADRQGPHRGGLGRLLRVLHGDRLAQMGPALPHPQVLLADRPEHGRQGRAGDGQARRPLHRRRHQLHRLATRCSAATGAPSSTTRSCISSFATTRPSTSPSTSKLKRVEAGAQGEHKLARGYLPVTTHSAHYIADPGLRRAIADYLVRERAYVEAAGEELAALAPFRKDLAEQEQD